MGCIYCSQDIHYMCQPTEDECCCKNSSDVPTLSDLNLSEGPRTVGRPLKTDGFKNLISTGRKRAAKLYAIQPGQICDWAWKKNCGGGVKPITGCSGRPAKNIHHGPDKSVLNNAPDNISVVCAHCHNKWHQDNDPYYPGERPADGAEWLPIDPSGEPIKWLADAEDADPVEILSFETTMGRKIDPDIFNERMKKYNNPVTNDLPNLTDNFPNANIDVDQEEGEKNADSSIGRDE